MINEESEGSNSNKKFSEKWNNSGSTRDNRKFNHVPSGNENSNNNNTNPKSNMNQNLLTSISIDQSIGTNILGGMTPSNLTGTYICNFL